MLEAFIIALIWCAVIMIVAYIVIWGLGMVFPTMPAQVTKLVWVIATLMCVLVLISVLLPMLPSLPGRRPGGP